MGIASSTQIDFIEAKINIYERISPEIVWKPMFIQPILVLANYPTLMYFWNLIFMNYDLALVVLETVMN